LWENNRDSNYFLKNERLRRWEDKVLRVEKERRILTQSRKERQEKDVIYWKYYSGIIGTSPIIY